MKTRKLIDSWKPRKSEGDATNLLSWMHECFLKRIESNPSKAVPDTFPTVQKAHIQTISERVYAMCKRIVPWPCWGIKFSVLCWIHLFHGHQKRPLQDVLKCYITSKLPLCISTTEKCLSNFYILEQKEHEDTDTPCARSFSDQLPVFGKKWNYVCLSDQFHVKYIRSFTLMSLILEFCRP